MLLFSSRSPAEGSNLETPDLNYPEACSLFLLFRTFPNCLAASGIRVTREHPISLDRILRVKKSQRSESNRRPVVFEDAIYCFSSV